MEPSRDRGERHPHHQRRQDRRHAGRERSPPDEVGGKRRTDEEPFGLQCLKRPHDKRQDIAGDHPEDHGGGDERGDTRGETERAEGGDDQPGNDHGSQEVRVRHGLAERGDKGDDGNVPGHEQRLAVGQGQGNRGQPGGRVQREDPGAGLAGGEPEGLRRRQGQGERRHGEDRDRDGSRQGLGEPGHVSEDGRRDGATHVLVTTDVRSRPQAASYMAHGACPRVTFRRFLRATRPARGRRGR